MYQEHDFSTIKDNGIRNGLSVNYDLINSKKYHDKFMDLTPKKEVNENLFCSTQKTRKPERNSI